MNLILKTAQVLTAAAMLPAAGCLVPHREMVRTVDRSKPMENARLWQQVKREPAMFIPRALPAGSPTGPAFGKWLVDPQDGTVFFIPNKTVAGLSPGVWEGEAGKHTNRYSLSGQRQKNLRTALVTWPFEAVGNAIVAFGSAGGGGGGVNYAGRGKKN